MTQKSLLGSQMCLCLSPCSRTWYTWAFYRCSKCRTNSPPRECQKDTRQGFICATHLQKMTNQSVLEVSGDLWIWNEIEYYGTSAKCSQAQFWRNDYSDSENIWTGFAQLLSNMLKNVWRETCNMAHAPWCQFQWHSLCAPELSWQSCYSKGCSNCCF